MLVFLDTAWFEWYELCEVESSESTIREKKRWVKKIVNMLIAYI